MLDALAPAALEVSLAAAGQAEARRTQVDQIWRQRLECAGFAADRARCQYQYQHRGQAVGPGCRIFVQRPSGMIADGQASTPGRGDPAAGQRGPGRFGLPAVLGFVGGTGASQ
jgi:hypothetical protein